jgi:hypothetical protein
MRLRSKPALLAWSVFGLIVGHQAAYLAVYQDPDALASVLNITGHGWLSFAPIFTMSTMLVAVVLGLRDSEPLKSLRVRFAVLALIQSAAFVMLEVTERQASGIDPGLLLSAAELPVLLIGLAVQTGLALLLALASRVVDEVAAAIRRARKTPQLRPSRRALAVTAGYQLYRATSTILAATAPRAPPLHA